MMIKWKKNILMRGFLFVCISVNISPLHNKKKARKVFSNHQTISLKSTPAMFIPSHRVHSTWHWLSLWWSTSKPFSVPPLALTLSEQKAFDMPNQLRVESFKAKTLCQGPSSSWYLEKQNPQESFQWEKSRQLITGKIFSLSGGKLFSC